MQRTLKLPLAIQAERELCVCVQRGVRRPGIFAAVVKRVLLLFFLSVQLHLVLLTKLKMANDSHTPCYTLLVSSYCRFALESKGRGGEGVCVSISIEHSVPFRLYLYTLSLSIFLSPLVSRTLWLSSACGFVMTKHKCQKQANALISQCHRKCPKCCLK